MRSQALRLALCLCCSPDLFDPTLTCSNSTFIIRQKMLLNINFQTFRVRAPPTHQIHRRTETQTYCWALGYPPQIQLATNQGREVPVSPTVQAAESTSSACCYDRASIVMTTRANIAKSPSPHQPESVDVLLLARSTAFVAGYATSCWQAPKTKCKPQRTNKHPAQYRKGWKNKAKNKTKKNKELHVISVSSPIGSEPSFVF